MTQPGIVSVMSGNSAAQAQFEEGGIRAPPPGMDIDESAVPAPGHPVAVLHADGVWYTGRLMTSDGEAKSEGESRWQIQFDDGDSEWYTLPHRSS